MILAHRPTASTGAASPRLRYRSTRSHGRWLVSQTPRTSVRAPLRPHDRVVRALAANPYWMSGNDRQEVRLASAAKEQLITKTGAEGVFMGALPERGIGVALKVRDGATRASELTIAAVLEQLGAIPSGHAVSDVVNAAGTVVGTMQVDIP